MKAITTIILLLIVAYTFAHSLENNYIAKRPHIGDSLMCGQDSRKSEECEQLYINNDDSKMCVENYNKYSKQCEYTEINVESKNELDNLCNLYNSNKCKQYFELNIKNLPGCKNLQPKLLKSLEKNRDNVHVALSLKCSKDENNNYCPLSKFKFTNSSRRKGLKIISIDINDKEFLKAIHNSCDSKKCYTTAIKTISSYKENNSHEKRSEKNKNEKEHTIDITNPNFCLKQFENDSGNGIKKSFNNTEDNNMQNIKGNSKNISNISTENRIKGVNNNGIEKRKKI